MPRVIRTYRKYEEMRYYPPYNIMQERFNHIRAEQRIRDSVFVAILSEFAGNAVSSSLSSIKIAEDLVKTYCRAAKVEFGPKHRKLVSEIAEAMKPLKAK